MPDLRSFSLLVEKIALYLQPQAGNEVSTNAAPPLLLPAIQWAYPAVPFHKR